MRRYALRFSRSCSGVLSSLPNVSAYSSRRLCSTVGVNTATVTVTDDDPTTTTTTAAAAVPSGPASWTATMRKKPKKKKKVKKSTTACKGAEDSSAASCGSSSSADALQHWHLRRMEQRVAQAAFRRKRREVLAALSNNDPPSPSATSVTVETSTASVAPRKKRDDTGVDRSLAGGVDRGVLRLVEAINSNPTTTTTSKTNKEKTADTAGACGIQDENDVEVRGKYVTLSSCSGRVSVFHRVFASNNKTTKRDTEKQTTTTRRKHEVGTARSKRGQGAEGTLFESHDVLTLLSSFAATASATGGGGVSETVEVAEASSVVIARALAEFSQRHDNNEKPLGDGVEAVVDDLLIFKFEPCILHVLCADVAAASTLLACASEAGMRRSGAVAPLVRVSTTASSATANPNPSEAEATTSVQLPPYVAYRRPIVSIASSVGFEVPLRSNGQWLLGGSPPHRTGLTSSNDGGGCWGSCLEFLCRRANVCFADNERRKRRLLEQLKRRCGLSANTAAAATVAPMD